MDDKILEKIKDQAEDIEIPESIRPENIRKKLDEAEKNKIKKFPVRRVVAAASAAVVLIAGVSYTSLRLHNDDGAALDAGVTAVVTEEQESASYNIPGVMHSAESYDDITKVIETARAEQEKEQRLYTLKNSFSLQGDVEYEAATEEVADGAAMDSAAGAGDMGAVKSVTTDDDVAHSDTNVRTADVDEGDIVKTDGKYIYQYFTSGEVRIIAINDGQMEKVSTIDVSGGYDTYVSEMYVKDDCLVLISDVYESSLENDKEEVYYYRVNDSETVHVMTYDISDRENPRSLGEVTIDGNYRTSRLVDGYLYVMSTYGQPLYYLYDYDINYVEGDTTYALDGVIPKINGTKIAAEDIMIPEKAKNEPFYTITSIKLTDPTKVVDTKSVMGYVDQVYASTGSLFFYSQEWNGKYDHTQIVKFSYKDGKITPEAAGSVRGYVDDSFCIDEDSDGNLRVATTTWSDDGSQESSLFILDKDMKKIGSLKDIAGNEGIKSCRFMGDIGYIVTFRNTDPLFTVDLSDPTNPTILSELTIPGFSEYLHYWGDGLLLGIGYDADIDDGGTTGVKLSMFDVSDPKNTKEVAKLSLDVDNSDVLYGNYKSILIDPSKNLLGFTASDWGDEDNDWEEKNYYMLFSYEDGEFRELKTKKLDGYTDNVRGIYAGDYFYLVNDKHIVSYDMDGYKKVAEID